MNSIIRLGVLLLCTAGAAQAAVPIEDLGMPLGQKLRAPVAPCSGQGPAKDAGAPCWVGQPTVRGGVQYGSLSVPASGQAREWAAPGTYGVAIDANGVLQAVTVRSARADEYAGIKGALTRSLGKRPMSARGGDRRSAAYWELRDVAVHLVCSADIGCTTRFVLDDAEGRRLRTAMNMQRW